MGVVVHVLVDAGTRCRALVLHDAVLEVYRAVHERRQRTQLVRDHDDSRACACEFGEDLREHLGALGVDARGRLVHDDEVGVGHQRAGDVGPLLLPAGQLGDGPVGQRGQPDPVDPLGRRPLLGTAGPADQGLAREDAAEDHLGDGGGHPGGDLGALGHVPEPRPAGEPSEWFAEQLDRAAERDEADESADEGRLARSVGAEDRDELAGGDLEVDPAQHRGAGQVDLDVSSGDDGFCHEQLLAFRSAARFSPMSER